MKKNLFFAAAALVLLAGCSSNEVTEDSESKAKSAQVPVTFGTYVGQTAVTRAGTAGTIDITALQGSGFGVFAYYTDGTDGTTYTSNGVEPNFMYNQEVTYGSSWTYKPIKYWPNETGTDGNGATSEGIDRLTFFAYAPYVKQKEDGTGEIDGATTEGITSFNQNGAKTDPLVGYTVATDPSKSVDLLWGVAKNTGTWENVAKNTSVTTTAGLPFLNLIKPSTTQKIEFQFKHALAKLGFKVVGAFDQKTAGGTLDGNTKITVKSVEIESTDKGFLSKGTLNLNNTTANEPKWEQNSGTTAGLSFTVEGEGLNSNIKDGGNKIQTVTGVKDKAVNLLNNDKDAYMLIPSTKDEGGDLTVKITYYVTTEDANLKKEGVENSGYSRVQNIISKKITGLKLAAGYSYTLTLTLGMTSVKVDATVENWENETTQSPVDLPINVE